MKRRECKYLLLLLMRKFNCLDKEIIKEQLKLKSDRTINNNIEEAEEKLLMNKEFRDDFFYLEEKIEKNINDMDQLKGSVKDINTSISNIIENIDNIKVQTDTSGGTIQNKFDQISSQLLNISEHLLKIDSSINNLETKIAGN